MESIKNGPTISNFAGFAYTKEKNKTDDPTKFKDINKFDSFKKAVKLFYPIVVIKRRFTARVSGQKNGVFIARTLK